MAATQSALFRALRHVFAACLLVASASPSFAAERPGAISGHVADASGNALPGATIVVRPGDFAVVTDREGRFVLPGLVQGVYTVEVSYLGFATTTQDVRLAPGASAPLDVRLATAPRVNDAVTVTASRVRGEVEALNQRKASMDLVDVLPVEVITSLPNANVADAIGRLPSVSLERDEGEGKYVQVRGLESRFTSVSIDGVRIPSAEAGVRQIKLDGFSSDLLGTIELHKTVSADREGDAIGGSVNLVNRTAGDDTFVSVRADGGYNSLQGGRYSGQASATVTNRFGPEKALGLVLSGTYDYNGRAINDIEPSPSVVDLANGGTANAFAGIDLRDYRYERKRYGFSGGLDYRLNTGSDIYLKGFFTQFENYGDRWVTSVSAGNFITPTLTDDSGGYSGSVQNRRPNEQTYSLSGGGKHDLGGALLDYALSYSRARQDRLNQYQADLNGPDAAFTVDSTNGYFPQLKPLGGVNQLDATLYTLKDFRTTNERTAARTVAVAANVAFPYDGGEIKVGGKYRDEDKTNAADDHRYKTTGTPLFNVSQNLDSLSDPNYYFGRYLQGPNLSLDAATKFFFASPGGFKVNAGADHLTNDPNIWESKEKVTAAYVKDRTRFGDFEFEAGLRFEHTSTNFTANLVSVDADGNWLSTSPTGGSNSYDNFLPSISVRWQIDPSTNLRAVYGWAVGRPDYGQLVPSRTEDDANKQLSAGNPALKATRGINYDFLFERYLAPVGVIAAGAFYKDLKDPIYDGSSSKVVGGLYDGYTLVQPVNGPSANIWGIELAWQQQLTFLPGALRGFSVNANYTHTHSKATFDPTTGRTGTAALQRTAPDVFNAGLTYDLGGFSFRIAATYNSAMIFTYNYQDGAAGGPTGPNGDSYLYPHTQIDAQASYVLGSGLEVVVSALNLNDQVFGFYNGSPQWNIQREFYNRTFTVGVRFTR
jgi:TonB-dependent receptor